MILVISPGRWRGLRTTSSPSGRFAILAFDQRGTYRRMLPEGTSYQDAVQIKREVVAALSPHATAVLLDPIYGLDAMLHLDGRSGLLLCLEKTGYAGEATQRRVDWIDGWTIEKIRRLGASAVKLLVYYHPDAGALTQEIEDVVAQVVAESHAHDLPLFLEPVSYSLDAAVPKQSAAFAAHRPAIVAETARRLSRLGVDVLKLEFPVDAAFNDDESDWQAGCEAISAACAVPWALLSAGVDFETYERQVRIACAAGASGFLAGRAIWREAIALPGEARQRFLATTATDRLQRLSAIVEESARPWTDFYHPIAPVEGWFHHYPASTD